MTAQPILNQPWADVADDVTGAIEKAVQPLLKRAVDSIYAGLLETTQDYLRDNLAFNIAERINAAERQADHDRREADRLRAVNGSLLWALEEGRRAVGDHFAPNDCYATGPLTGDAIRDIVQCPACAFIARYDALAKARGEA